MGVLSECMSFYHVCTGTTEASRACQIHWNWNVVNVHNETPLENTNFSFSDGYLITDRFLVRSLNPPDLSAGTLPGLKLCRYCVCCYSLWVHMCSSPVVSGEHCFLGVIHHLWPLHSFCLLFFIGPWVPLGGFDEDIAFITGCSNVSHSLNTI